MKKFFEEFKEFAFKGNMIDLAVGMIIGGTFSNLIKSAVENIFMPIISIFTGKIDFENMFIPLAGQKTHVYVEAVKEGAVIGYGAFITEFIQFIIMALIIFIFIKKVNTLKKDKEKEVTTKICPYCKSVISKDAVKCPNCTSTLDK